MFKYDNVHNIFLSYWCADQFFSFSDLLLVFLSAECYVVYCKRKGSGGIVLRMMWKV